VLFGLSRQSYYKNKTSRIKRSADLIIVRDMVMRIRCKMPRIGTRKLYHLIKDELNRKQTVDLLISHESFDFISFPIFLPCNKKLQEHWVIKLNIQTIK
jgi:hypothetical protein